MPFSCRLGMARSNSALTKIRCASGCTNSSITASSSRCRGRTLVTGTGVAAHYRLTDCHYAGQAPTYDFQSWDGVLYDPEKIPVRKIRTHCPKKPDTGPANEARKRNKRPKVSDIRNDAACPKNPDITSLNHSLQASEAIPANDATDARVAA
jgi:hypothetical protein